MDDWVPACINVAVTLVRYVGRSKRLVCGIGHEIAWFAT